MSIVAENHPMNEYPDEEEFEEEDEDSEFELEEPESDNSSNKSSDENLEHHAVSKHVADPLYDEEFDDYEGANDDSEDEDWR